MSSWSLSVKVVTAFAGLVIAILVGKAVGPWLAANWVTLVLVPLTIVVLTVAGVAVHRYRHSAERAEYAELERHLARADEMNLPQFESWVGQLLLRDGFRHVRYMGRSGDYGSNFVATAPDARQVVVRAKPDDGTLGTRGARHIQALGADIHGRRWKVDAALLITNADLHPLKTAGRHDQLAEKWGVVLIDRWELATWVADRKPPAQLTAEPAGLPQ